MKRHNSKWERSSNADALKEELGNLGTIASEQLGHADMHKQYTRHLPQPKHFYQDEYCNYAEV